MDLNNPITGNKQHSINIVRWLLDEILASGGDGDGIWLSEYFSIQNIKEFILKEGLLPHGWKIVSESGDTIVIGESQECLVITNSKKVFDERPEWQQVALVY